MPVPLETINPLVRRSSAALFLALVFGLTLWVLSPFFSALAWSGILAYMTWPLFRRLRSRLPGHETLAALLMSIVVTVALLAPLAWVMFAVADDVGVAAGVLRQIAASGLPSLPATVSAWPGGGWLLARYAEIQTNPAWLHASIEALGLTELSTWGAVVGGVGRNLAKFALAVFALFFLFRHGAQMLTQFGRVSAHWLGGSARAYLDAVGLTVRAVVFGIVLTAIAQGCLAGLGYWVAGTGSPALWGAVTALISLIPFVGPVVWIGLSLALLANGETQAGVGLFLWGAFVVSWVDNLIRPLAISGPTKIPFLLVFLGVLGGIRSFGLIGLFLGPVLIAVSLAIWHQALDQANSAGSSTEALPHPAPSEGQNRLS
ncbi:AI-2E family transporter [Niveibacterium terrae]|uniref:AI-2E family transporter n=1 Tax=Niveibacterium terrae TaxID=3373598 RepID=UPI003A8F0923